MKTAQRLGAALVLLAGLAGAKPAAAAMNLCNQTSYILYAAVGYESGLSMLTRGWLRITPGACATAIAERLSQPAYFIYARTSQGHAGPARAWGGPIRLCAKDTDFSLQAPVGSQDCGSADAFLMPFASIATHNAGVWTTTFTQYPPFSSPEQARQAGIDRLLADIGYKVNLGDGRSNSARADALATFRARMRLAANVTPDALFAALESEARKAAAPAGYSICNDGDSEIWAALGLLEGRKLVSRGWWTVPPRGCAKAVTTPLTTDKVYLLAEKQGNNHLVAGPAKFCVTDVEFEIYDTGRCAARGLTEAGFAVTGTRGLSGYAAHVNNNGLEPAAPKLSQARVRQ